MTLPEFSIDGNVIVTGASRGIGAVVCQALARRGARVFALARSERELAETVDGLEGQGHEHLIVDVADPLAWPAVIESASADGPVAGVVTAAALLEPIGPLDEIDESAFRRTIDVNVTGTMLAIRAALPQLRERGGTVVTFSGGGATKPLPRYDAYAASKAAVARLTENVARSEPSIRVNAIAPGFVATRMHEATLAAGPERAGAEYLADTERRLERGGVPPERSAELAATLIGPLGEGITGKLISAQWDPWEDESFRRRLRTEADLCTLRRIDDVFFTAGPGEGG